ncbi:MAG: PaaI family thioesterase [Staphylococcus epidermidis]|nr:PaaI family thioesterase [Staphylococcus epidermidis]
MTNLLETFEMKIEQKEDGKVVVSMPVTDKVKQPFGYLHGGASLALGETACSIGAAHLIDTQHVRAFASLIHQGKTTQVWNIDIKDDHDQLISVMRGTIAIKPIQ